MKNLPVKGAGVSPENPFFLRRRRRPVMSGCQKMRMTEWTILPDSYQAKMAVYYSSCN
jgi:hypothetical protein